MSPADGRPPVAVAGEGVRYWEARTRALGSRAVISTDHDGDLDLVTQHHRALLIPRFAEELARDVDAEPSTVLDLGCGNGRLTSDVAAVAGHAIGVDPVEELLVMAPADGAVEYRLLDDPAGPLPLADGEADAVFTCLVLGGIERADELAHTGAELLRVLRPGGLLFLAESVSDQPRVAHWTFRSVEDYRAAMPWADLEEVATFDDAGDAVSVLVGRRP